MQSTVAEKQQEFVMFLTSDQCVIALWLAALGHRGEDIADLSPPPPAWPSPCSSFATDHTFGGDDGPK